MFSKIMPKRFYNFGKNLLLLSILSLLFCTNNYTQQYERSKLNPDILPIPTKFNSSENDTGSYKIKVWTINQIGIFSYFDSTIVSIYNESNALIGSADLVADTIYIITPGQGFYWVQGNKPLTILLGDPFSFGVSGYFAIDENGQALSTKLNTWMMKNSYTQTDFIVFGYTDNTIFTVRNLITKELIRTDTINRGEHYSFRESGGVPYNTALQVTASAPVTALSYSDQDYYVPSENGTFSGTVFYGFSAYNGSWSNSITVTSYADSNLVIITNTVTGDTINSYWAFAGQVHSDSIKTPTFWKIESLYPVTAANIPYAGIDISYAFMTRVYDSDGTGFGKLFYMPSIQITTWVTSLQDSNSVSFTQLGKYDEFPYTQQQMFWNGILNRGEVRGFTSNFGHYVFKIEGSGKLYVMQCSGQAGADFIPLVTPSMSTDIWDWISTPYNWKLYQNYPNPFNPSTKISWQSPVGSQQTLKIYDVLGNEIITLFDEYKPAGRYEVEFNASSAAGGLPSGVYFYQLKAGEYINTRKMILLK